MLYVNKLSGYSAMPPNLPSAAISKTIDTTATCATIGARSGALLTRPARPGAQAGIASARRNPPISFVLEQLQDLLRGYDAISLLKLLLNAQATLPDGASNPATPQPSPASGRL